MPDQDLINGVCPHDCPDACGIRSTVVGDRVIEIKGHPGHVVTGGWLCAKVTPYLEQVYHPDRLLYPLRRDGPKGNGAWRAISWDEAIDQISDRWRGIVRTSGPEAILPYSYSGTLGLVQMTLASSRFWNRLGASRLERSICMAATRLAVRCTLGARRSPQYHHVLDSRLVVMWAHNPVSTAPHLMPFLREARRRGTKVILIDPYRSRSARGADVHLQPRPGTDAALALGLAHEINRKGLANHAWLAANTIGWKEYLERIEHYPLERVAKICDLELGALSELAEDLGSRSPAMIRLGDGINRNRRGGQTVRAIAALPALLGQYGVRGGGLGCSTGDYFGWDEEAINHWQECPRPGRIVNMNRIGAALTGEVSDPPIRSLFVFCANPMISAPNTSLIQKGLLRDDLFTVVHDLYLTETARYADIVLPATTQLEHTDLHRGYGHTLLAYNQQAIPPRGEARCNWTLMRDLAAAMGFDEEWLHQSPDEAIDEVLRATVRQNKRLEGITLLSLRGCSGVAYADPDEVPFEDLCFPTASNRIELMSKTFAEHCGDPLPAWEPLPEETPPAGEGSGAGLNLLSPAAHHFLNSSLANLPSLAAKERDARVLLNPLDASARDLKDGTLVEIHNRRGTCKLRLEVSGAVKPGVAVSFKGFPNQRNHGTVNRTTSDQLADVAGQSTFHSNQVWVRPAS